MTKKKTGPVVVVDPKGPLAENAIRDVVNQILATGKLPVFDPFKALPDPLLKR